MAQNCVDLREQEDQNRLLTASQEEMQAHVTEMMDRIVANRRKSNGLNPPTAEGETAPAFGSATTTVDDRVPIQAGVRTRAVRSPDSAGSAAPPHQRARHDDYQCASPTVATGASPTPHPDSGQGHESSSSPGPMAQDDGYLGASPISQPQQAGEEDTEILPSPQGKSEREVKAEALGPAEQHEREANLKS